MKPLRSPTARIQNLAGALVMAALCGACGHSAPTEFLTLQPIVPTTAPISTDEDPVRVIAVRVPPWLDRLQVARPAGPASVTVEDFKRWSAPVGDLALATLTQDLADRLPGVPVLPARAAPPPTTRDLSVELVSLTAGDGAVELNAIATLTDARTGGLISSLRLHQTIPGSLANATDEALVLDRLLGQLADQLVPSLTRPPADT